MKKFFIIILFSLIFLPTLVLAAGPDIGITDAGVIAGKAGFEAANQYSLSQITGRYIRVAMGMVGMIFLALTVYAGFLWMTASGNEEQVTKAKDIVQRATLGLVIVLAAYSITIFVLAAVGASTGADSTAQTGGSGPQGCTGGFTCWWEGFKNQATNYTLGQP